jgi:hypothetical protein
MKIFMKTNLSLSELEFLEKLKSFPDKQGIINDKKKEEVIARLQNLIHKGYVRLSAAVSGPLFIKTGETLAILTEAGEIAMSTQEQQKVEELEDCNA